MVKRKSRAQRDKEEHEFALADLQDAVDRTSDDSHGDGEADWIKNLKRARDREQAAHDALHGGRERPRKQRRKE